MEVERNRVHSIEVVELYLGAPCSMFAPLTKRIVAEITPIKTQDILRSLCVLADSILCARLNKSSLLHCTTDRRFISTGIDSKCIESRD